MFRFHRPARILCALILAFASAHLSSAQPAPPAGAPITHAQLAEYLLAAGSLEGAKSAADMQLTQSHKRIPAWFPPAVWAAFEQKVRAVDLAEIYLPVYRKYLSAENLSGLIVVYQGPTGEEFAHVSTQRVIDAIRQGAAGHAADTNAANAMETNGESAILAKLRLAIGRNARQRRAGRGWLQQGQGEAGRSTRQEGAPSKTCMRPA